MNRQSLSLWARLDLLGYPRSSRKSWISLWALSEVVVGRLIFTHDGDLFLLYLHFHPPPFVSRDRLDWVQKDWGTRPFVVNDWRTRGTLCISFRHQGRQPFHLQRQRCWSRTCGGAAKRPSWRGETALFFSLWSLLFSFSSFSLSFVLLESKDIMVSELDLQSQSLVRSWGKSGRDILPRSKGPTIHLITVSLWKVVGRRNPHSNWEGEATRGNGPNMLHRRTHSLWSFLLTGPIHYQISH